MSEGRHCGHCAGPHQVDSCPQLNAWGRIADDPFGELGILSCPACMRGRRLQDGTLEVRVAQSQGEDLATHWLTAGLEEVGVVPVQKLPAMHADDCPLITRTQPGHTHEIWLQLPAMAGADWTLWPGGADLHPVPWLSLGGAARHAASIARSHPDLEVSVSTITWELSATHGSLTRWWPASRPRPRGMVPWIADSTHHDRRAACDRRDELRADGWRATVWHDRHHGPTADHELHLVVRRPKRRGAGGRPPKQLDLELIRKLMARGWGSLRIQRELQRQGGSASRSLVALRMRDIRQEVEA